MPNEGFLKRWSRLKTEPEPAALTPAPVPATEAAEVVAPEAAAPPPTLADAALLDTESDYSAFVARGVGADVRRLAMKKLFADPHFNVIDGLDIYMADYNVPSPVSAAMLASLSHAKSVFARIDELVEPAADDTPPSITAAAPATEAPPSITTAAPATEAPAPPPPDQEVA